MGKSVKFTEDSGCLQICIVGAGFSGLCAAVQLKRKLSMPFTIYDINNEVGGCWLTNSYPGSACSIPAHLYSYSFAPKSDWSLQFAAQEEILEYLKDVARKFDIYKHVNFRCEVEKLQWNQELNKWSVCIFNRNTNEKLVVLYDIVIQGSGQLRVPEKPKEFMKFQGPIIHTGEWDQTLKLEGKTVAVIGSGATAVQLIPKLANKVPRLLSYQRRPVWLFPGFQLRFALISKIAFARIPGLRRTYRNFLFGIFHIIGTRLVKRGPVINACALSVTTWGSQLYSRFQLRNAPDLRKSLAPAGPLNCKIPGLSSDYYAAFKLPHVELITCKIVEVSENFITTQDGKQEKVDVIILATGFRAQDFFAPMEVIGRNFQNILTKWKKFGPSAYLGISSCDMPNHFMLFGPGTGVIHSLIFQIECQVHFVIEVLKEMMKRKAKVVTVKKGTELKYMKEMDEAIKKTVYGKPDCAEANSWMVNSRSAYPKSCINYWRRTRTIVLSDFEFL